MILLGPQNQGITRQSKNYGIDLLILEIFIYQNTRVGIQYLMKPIIIQMKLLKKMEKSFRLSRVHKWSGLKRILFFLNYLPGKKSY